MPTPIQEVSGQTPGSAQASIGATVAALTAGSAVFVNVVWNTKTRSLASVVAAGCTFTQVVSIVNASAGNLNLWVAYNVSGGATSITANINTGTSQGVMQIIEVPGLGTVTDNSANTPNTTATTTHPQALTPVDTTDSLFYVGAMGIGTNLVATQTGTGFTESAADVGISGSRSSMAWGTFASGGATQTVNFGTPSTTPDGRALMSVAIPSTGITWNAPTAAGTGAALSPVEQMVESALTATGVGAALLPSSRMVMSPLLASGRGVALLPSAFPSGGGVVYTRPYWRHPHLQPWSEKEGLA